MNPWYICRSQPHAVHRIYCFPHAGGGVSSYLNWQNELAPHTEVCVIQLPGHGVRFNEPLSASLSNLVVEFAQSIAEHANLSFTLYGHSLGALLSYEVARRLCHELGKKPVRLIVSGCEAAHLKQVSKGYQHLSDAELLELLQQFQGTSAATLQDSELTELMMPAIRGDFALVDQYVYRHSKSLDIPLTVLSGLDDDHIERDFVPRWSELTTGTCDVHWYPGGHFFHDSNREGIALRLNSQHNIE